MKIGSCVISIAMALLSPGCSDTDACVKYRHASCDIVTCIDGHGKLRTIDFDCEPDGGTAK